MSKVFYIGNTYVSKVEELRELLIKELHTTQNNITKDELYQELNTLFHDDVLLNWLLCGSEEDKKVAQKVKLIDKKLNRSEIISKIVEAITNERFEIKKHIKDYLEFIGAFYKISGKEFLPITDKIELSCHYAIRLELLFKFQTIQSVSEKFSFILKQDSQVLAKVDKNIGDFIKDSKKELKFSPILSAETNEADFQLIIDNDMICQFKLRRI